MYTHHLNQGLSPSVKRGPQQWGVSCAAVRGSGARQFALSAWTRMETQTCAGLHAAAGGRLLPPDCQEMCDHMSTATACITQHGCQYSPGIRQKRFLV